MLIHPNIDPIAFSIGPLAVRWYGLMYLAGFAVGWWLGVRRIARPGADHPRAARRPAVPRRARRDPRRAPGLRAVLQARLLPRRIRSRSSISGRAACRSTAAPRRAGRDGCSPRAASASTGCGLMDFVAPLVPLGLRRRAPRQFHQRRAAGARHRPALGHGVPRRRRRAAPSLAALPVRARGRGAVRAAVVVLVEAAAARPGVGDVPASATACCASSPSSPRARCLPRLPRARPDAWGNGSACR